MLLSHRINFVVSVLLVGGFAAVAVVLYFFLFVVLIMTLSVEFIMYNIRLASNS